MKKKSLLLASLLGATMMCAACSDDSANESKKPTTPEPGVEKNVTYSLTCAAPTDCNLVLNANQSGQLRIQLSSLSSEQGAVPTLVSDAIITATVSGSGFSIQGDTATAELNTNSLGQAILNIFAGEEAGSGSVKFVTASEQGSVDVTFNITVNAAPTVVDPEQPPVQPEDVTYKINLNYQGDKSIKYGEVLYFVDKSCSDIIKDEMTGEEVMEVSGEADSEYKRVATSLSALSFDFKVKSDDTTVYSVFARGTNAGLGMAFGCEDGLGPDKQSVTIALKDVKTNPVVVDPDDPHNPEKPDDPIIDPPDPGNDPVVIYEGTYALTSQFDALSLLPHAEGTNVAFKDMLMGDWIKFTLDVLADPAAAVPNIITDQLLPLILNAEWFSKFVGSVLPESIASMLTPEVVANLIKTFGLDIIIENSLKELTANLTWWDTATGSVKMVKELVENFTLRGAFDIPAGAQPDASGKISGINHRYLRVLYHNGTFNKCFAGTEFGSTVDGDLICSIGLDKLDASASGAVSGRFDATFSKNGDIGTVDIAQHNLNLAYGRLIYGVIMEFVPMIAGMSDSEQAPKTLSELIAYYLGKGVLNFWNSKHEDAQITENLSGCAAFGTVASKFLLEKIGSDGTFGTLIQMFANASNLGSLCETGIHKLDEFIDGQLDKLSLDGSAISFTSDDCKVYYRSATNYSQLTNFGVPQKWGSKAEDLRCDWKVSIATSTPHVIDGKFAAGDERD